MHKSLYYFGAHANYSMVIGKFGGLKMAIFQNQVKKRVIIHYSTGCCLNRYFVSTNFGEYFLFSEFGLIYAQPIISAIWQGKSLSKVRQNRAILLASRLNRLSRSQDFVLLACSTAFAATRICNAVAGSLTSFTSIIMFWIAAVRYS